MERKFIMTTSAETADILTNAGFQLVYSDNNSWTFLNNKNLAFSNLKEIAFTNKLVI